MTQRFAFQNRKFFSAQINRDSVSCFEKLLIANRSIVCSWHVPCVRRGMKFIFCFLLTIAIFTMLEKAKASNMILDWRASMSPNVIGYHVYYGTTSGNYPYKVNAGNTTMITISNLDSGGMYYFVATAYTASGRESPYSAAIKVLVPQISQIFTKPAWGLPTTVAPDVNRRPAVLNKSSAVYPERSVVLDLKKSSAAAVAAPPVAEVMPGAVRLAVTRTADSRGPALMQFSVQQGHWYEVQATTDFQNWNSIWQSDVAVSDGSMQFTDPDSKSFTSRFYRLVAH
jgi:hypothetical protein